MPCHILISGTTLVFFPRFVGMADACSRNREFMFLIYNCGNDVVIGEWSVKTIEKNNILFIILFYHMLSTLSIIISYIISNNFLLTSLLLVYCIAVYVYFIICMCGD